MTSIKPDRVDLNLMLALHVLLDERNVTRAAARLRVSQPAMSATLARLRGLLDDDLLVRQGRGMVLTPVAEALQPSVDEAVRQIVNTFTTRGDFDPATSSASFTILTSDYVALVLLQPLIRHLESEARHVRLRVRPILDDFGTRLRAGTADIAILPQEIATGSTGLLRAPVFEDRYVYVSDVRHPAADGHASWTELAGLPHVGYGGDQFPSVGQIALSQVSGMHEQDVTTQAFLLSAFLVQDTDFISLIPRRLAELLKERLQIAVFDPPSSLAVMTETAFWSVRTDDDPAHRWLRQQLADTARALDEP